MQEAAALLFVLSEGAQHCFGTLKEDVVGGVALPVMPSGLGGCGLESVDWKGHES